MKKYIFFSPANLLKGEVPGVVNSVIRIVEKWDPVALGVEPFYNLLLEGKAQLVMFSNNNGKHPLSKVIKNDRRRLLRIANSLETQFRGVEKGEMGDVADAILVMIPVMKQLAFLYRLSSKIAEPRVVNFLTSVKADETVRSAATTLGFDIYIDQLELLQKRIESNSDIRRKDLSKRRMSNRPVVKVEILSALTNLLKAIELAKVQYPAVNYLPLIAELNELFIPYRAVGRSRSTRNKNEAIKNETVAMSTTTSATAS